MKPLCVVFITAAVLLSLSGNALAQPAQLSYMVTLNWFNLRVTYPSVVMPGGVLNVSVQGTPKNAGVYLQNLTATIYYGDASGLHQLASETVVSNAANIYAYYGEPTTGSFSTNFKVNVPEDAPRTSLIVVFTETTQYNNYYNGLYPFSYWYFGNPIFYSYYPSFTATTDQAISPLSYINATTPEYVALQAEYRMLQQRMNQTQTQNQQLQTTITQQSAMISQLDQQLTSANASAQRYESVAAVLAFIAVGLGAFNVYQISRRKMRDKADTTEPH